VKGGSPDTLVLTKPIKVDSKVCIGRLRLPIGQPLVVALRELHIVPTDIRRAPAVRSLDAAHFSIRCNWQSGIKTKMTAVLMLNSYEVHYLLGSTKQIVKVPALRMSSLLAWKIALTDAGGCAGRFLPVQSLEEIAGLARCWNISSVRWNKAVLFHTLREVTGQHRRLTCPYPVDQVDRNACAKVACEGGSGNCAALKNHYELEPA
jgi:hypothetical protein